MRTRLPIAVALPAVAILVALCATPAAAAPPSTPLPALVDRNQSPSVVADASGGLSIIRVLPDALQTQAAGELGLGLAVAQANSQAANASEHAIAESSPAGFAVAGNAPRLPGALAQAALPDNDKPETGGLHPPATPLDVLLKLGLLEGSVHARWNDKLGPCVDPIADAKTSLASLSAVNAIPPLPIDPNALPLSDKLTPEEKTALIDGLGQLAEPLNRLGGLLSGQLTADGMGSLLRLPDTISAQSTVRLVDVPGQQGKAAQATSTVQASSIQLLAGTTQELRIDVVSKPKLVATSTGDPNTSKVTYEAPVLRVSQGGKVLGTLDAANPRMDLPIGIPLPDGSGLKKLPLIGQLAGAGIPKIDIGALRLEIGQLSQKREGAAVGAIARLLDLQLLPTDVLQLPGLPKALAQVTIGEQVTRAATPAGGVVCQVSNPVQPQQPAPLKPQPKQPLAYTTAAYHTVPLFWIGTALLLIGVIAVAATPRQLTQSKENR